MKQAIIGTEDYHATMKQVAANALQHIGGYIPQVVNTPIEITPVGDNFAACADEMVQEITLRTTFKNCNPRSPYLWLVWLLVGSDNLKRIRTYSDNDALHQQVAILHIRIAIGEIPFQDEIRKLITPPNAAHLGRADFAAIAAAYTAMQAAVGEPSYAAANVAETIHDAAFTVEKSEIGIKAEAVQEYWTQRMREWVYISDPQALQIARQLTFDILDWNRQTP